MTWPCGVPMSVERFSPTHVTTYSGFGPERPRMDCPVLPQAGAAGHSKQKDGWDAGVKYDLAFIPGSSGRTQKPYTFSLPLLQSKPLISEGECGEGSQTLLGSLGVLLNLGRES